MDAPNDPQNIKIVAIIKQTLHIHLIMDGVIGIVLTIKNNTIRIKNIPTIIKLFFKF